MPCPIVAANDISRKYFYEWLPCQESLSIAGLFLMPGSPVPTHHGHFPNSIISNPVLTIQLLEIFDCSFLQIISAPVSGNAAHFHNFPFSNKRLPNTVLKVQSIVFSPIYLPANLLQVDILAQIGNLQEIHDLSQGFAKAPKIFPRH